MILASNLLRGSMHNLKRKEKVWERNGKRREVFLPVVSIEIKPYDFLQDFYSFKSFNSLDDHILANCSKAIKHKLINLSPRAICLRYNPTEKGTGNHLN